jgi:DNA-directed RNA polymerase subunit RPC12/RpoP
MTSTEKTSAEETRFNENDGQEEISTIPARPRPRGTGEAEKSVPATRLLDCGYCGHHAMMVVPLIDESGNRVGKTVLCTQCENHRTLMKHVHRKAPGQAGGLPPRSR